MELNAKECLICPLDGLALHDESSRLICEKGHSFDIAKQGYVNLLPVQFKRSRAPGDSEEMVMARRRLLASGAYEPVAHSVVQEVMKGVHTRLFYVLDAGCGEGYYLAYLRQSLSAPKPDYKAVLCGVDISKPAILAAAKQYKPMQNDIKQVNDITWVVGSNKQLPLREQSMDVVLCMFGFPAFQAFKKVLKPGGCVIVVDPSAEHLIELRRLLYGEVRKNAPSSHHEAEKVGFSLMGERGVHYQFKLTSPKQIVDIAQMTPHYFRAKREARERLARLAGLDVTVSVSIKTLRL